MKHLFLLSILLVVACNNNTTVKTEEPDTSGAISDTVTKNTEKENPLPQTYFNKRFKDVTVEKTGNDTFLIRGKAQIFEATLNWSVEDGHEELKKGFQMTDAGAPEWGKFEFTIHVPKKRKNSTLTLILFESSPKDGSRQYELPIVLN